MSGYGFTLASLTAVDADDIGSWVERARSDLSPAEVVASGETDSVLRLETRCFDRTVRATVYKNHGRVRIESDGVEPRAFERYLCDQLELTILSQVERALPETALPRLEENTSQKALMEMFRTLGATGSKRSRQQRGGFDPGPDTWFGGVDLDLGQ